MSTSCSITTEPISRKPPSKLFYFSAVSLSFITCYVSVLFIYWCIFMSMLSLEIISFSLFTWLYLLNRILHFKLLEGLRIRLPDFCCELFVTVPTQKIALLTGEMCCLFIISNKSHDLVIVYCALISLWTWGKVRIKWVGSNHVYITFVMIHTL